MTRTRFVPPPDTGTLAGVPFAGLDGHQYVKVKLDTSGATVTVAVLASSTPYTSGLRVAVQMYPTGAKVAGVVLGVLA